MGMKIGELQIGGFCLVLKFVIIRTNEEGERRKGREGRGEVKEETMKKRKRNGGRDQEDVLRRRKDGEGEKGGGSWWFVIQTSQPLVWWLEALLTSSLWQKTLTSRENQTFCHCIVSRPFR